MPLDLAQVLDKMIEKNAERADALQFVKQTRR